MLELIRNRIIRKQAYNGPTGMLPLSSIRRATVLLDVEDADYEECKKRVGEFFGARGIEVRLLFLLNRKMARDEILTTCVQTTLTRHRLTLLGLPDSEYMRVIKGEPGAVPDGLFLNAAYSDQPAVRMIAAAIPARFKVGVLDYPLSPYNLVVHARQTEAQALRVGDHNSAAALMAVFDNLKKIV